MKQKRYFKKWADYNFKIYIRVRSGYLLNSTPPLSSTIYNVLYIVSHFHLTCPVYVSIRSILHCSIRYNETLLFPASIQPLLPCVSQSYFWSLQQYNARKFKKKRTIFKFWYDIITAVFPHTLIITEKF